MTVKSWADFSDDELAAEAQRGLQGQGAIIEALRRHREMIAKLDRASTRLTWVGLGLGVVGI